MVTRKLNSVINGYLFKNKTIILYGARQTGKTTLIHQLLDKIDVKVLIMNADEQDIRELFSDFNPKKLLPYITDQRILLIDEAQRLNEAGLVLKIIHDNYKELQLIVTGSSSFDLANSTKEPLTGRKFEFTLYPFSFAEMTDYHGFLTEKRLIEHRMIFGYYPDIALNIGKEVKLLKSLASSYLYKDLLILGTIKKPVLLEKILKALALQISNEVSYNELAQLLSSDKETIEKYIDLLEKTGIIFRLEGFSRNLRNEIKRNRKIYFYDNGIRNAVLGNFTHLNSRTDAGALWENYMVSERIKYLEYNEIEAGKYFWRTTQKQEIDYIEERQDMLYAFEFKWNPAKKPSVSKTFIKNYPNNEFKVIHPGNFHEFLM